ncbi:Retinol dehydrogenase 14 [Tolypocladium paradoxum]|uniref:Retinol dehydrogenase 14 n=1 Tax=Tolypocladium paradoxum TaxID=94208 RepID=A0A2S4L5J6_9HYPO|nr:Retinol dehydrogenase 14 [Tolypocladium paradoxum]
MSSTDIPTAAALSAKYAPLIADKTILTTGVSPTSIGAPFVRALAAASPALLILAGRSAPKLAQTAAAIAEAYPHVRTRTLTLDLASLKAVRAAADEVLAWDDVPAVHVLVANAGVMGTPYARTEDGVESQFAVNHLAHFLFTNLIMGKLLAAEAPRVKGETYNKWIAYGQSKTANMLFALSLAEKLGGRGLGAYSLHPGVIGGTGLSAHLDFSATGDFAELHKLDQTQGNAEGFEAFNFINPEQGAATHVFAAFDPSLKDHNGAYLLECRLADPYVDTVKPWATSSIEADRLWKLSEKLVGQEFSY